MITGRAISPNLCTVTPNVANRHQMLQIANETINCEVLTYDKNRGPVDNVNTHYNKSPIVGDSSKFTPQLM